MTSSKRCVFEAQRSTVDVPFLRLLLHLAFSGVFFFLIDVLPIDKARERISFAAKTNILNTLFCLPKPLSSRFWDVSTQLVSYN